MTKYGQGQVNSLESAQVERGGWDTFVPARDATDDRLSPLKAEVNNI